ncbi:Protein SABRE [Recurvomyces mirabilis]|uniref:Protein SABRE n=1 Tax=Recurvomyces mirabilis TaxID=574656 RepID=A0AAE1C6H9_9PEZI|nr:Protein SABRE [Recurvomyces mirabilis]KAK5162015.1 Protein SABRE [Recurvomyces mirabilis]
MPLPTASFLLGLVVLGYLFTFVVFAVLRILTGVSIQRVGYSGFRRVSFSPRPGLRIHVRGLGLSLHRPTFALPTWCSLVVTELAVTVDLKAISSGKPSKPRDVKKEGNGAPRKSKAEQEAEEGHGKLWRKLMDVKERIKRLHSKINYIRLVDLVAIETSVNVVGVGSIELERLTLSVDTRSKTVDRSRLFQHHKTKPESQAPAEWKCVVRSILFTADGRESSELLDYCALNIHGMLHNELQGLRDASIALKLGRLNVPYDDIEHAKKCADLLRGKYAQPHAEHANGDLVLTHALKELQKPGSHDEDLVRTVSDSRAFVASILRGIQEVQFAVSFFGLSQKLAVKGHSDKDVYLNLAMKEVGLDVLRLDPKSPAHRMYFSTKDVAHQGLVTAIAISAGIDDGHEHPERMVYIPMVTATVKTTLPSRTIHYNKENNAKDRNTNMLYANFVCTSPSVDLDPKHLPLVRDILKRRTSSKSPPPHARSNRHNLVSQLLPKAHVKLSIQEPVIRVSLPPMDKANTGEEDFDLLISSMSSMAFDLESSHAAEEGVRYSFATQYRHTRHHLYYQTVAGERHDLMQSDTVEVQVDVNAIPEPSVTANAQFRTLSLFLVRPDICAGVRQIVRQLRKNVLARPECDPKKTASFLRTLPPWLDSCRMEGTDFSLELAGVDDQVSKDTRGFALQLESWNTDYKAHRENIVEPIKRRRSFSKDTSDRDRPSSRQASPRRRYQSFADGRRLTVHVQNLEGLIVDSVEAAEPEQFLSLPRFEVAFSTTTDSNGPIFHINSHAKSLLLQYSLYHHFAMGVAVMVIKKTFLEHVKEDEKRPAPVRRQPSLTVPGSPLSDSEELDELARTELTTIDFKAKLVQIKARMPADPPMMLQLCGIETGRHRWSNPFMRCRMARMYARAPRTKQVWSRVVGTRNLRADLRDIKRKAGRDFATERSFDIVADNVRFSVPHSLIVHSIFDNITNIIKTSKQLQHHFVTGTNEYVLTKEPEKPKHVPRITLRTKQLLLNVEDSGFEWKLGAIYRTGLQEQKQRLAREEAFRLKEKRLSRTAARGSSRFRAQSAHLGNRSRSRNRTPTPNTGKQRSHSGQATSRATSKDRHRHGRHALRYDADGRCGISDSSQLSIERAREKLQLLNSQSWKNRIDRVLQFQTHAIKEIRDLMLGADDIEEEAENQESILALNQRPGLMTAIISELNLTVDKPSFPLEDYPKFLHDIGKGMPYDMIYGLLLPMNLHLTMGELRFQLRDYPLPLLHVPMLANGQSPRLPTLALRTDFVIAEEFRDIESQRSVKVEVVPTSKMNAGADAYAIDVRRTISAVKTYSDMKFEIHTSNPTKITWGTSYQPAIQDTMQVIEGFTKPPYDPSDRVGFWDKIRLSFHSRVNVAWKGDGDLHLILKGTRDPYTVTGNGAGLVMVWRNDVRWNVAQNKDGRKFMTVDSGDYILAVPDFNSYARRSQENGAEMDGTSSTSSYKRDAIFRKVVMKLSGKVQWLAGLVFERDTTDGKRLFDFKPHYDVVLKHPDFAKASPGENYDAYRGFRSDHIHMSIAVIAPHGRDWSVTNSTPSDNYNAVHLTPKFFSHFFSWWSMFSGIMSLPVRQGPLWGAMQKKSKKFGRHIATIKYNLLLSPLYISHVYKHKEAEDYKGSTVSATGLKMKLNSFMLDLHQRREHFDIKDSEGTITKKTSAMRINQAQLDFIHADLRALSASIAGTSSDDIDKADDDLLASLQGQSDTVDMSKFDIPDNDFGWIDMDDFVELDWILPAESDPETKILPLGFAPRFTYFRQTDHGGTIAGDPSRTSPFGDEPTHYCNMSTKADPRRVQVDLIEHRLDTLREQREHNERAIGDQELKLAQTGASNKHTLQQIEKKLGVLRSHSEHIQKKRGFLENMLATLMHRLEHNDPAVVPELETSEAFFDHHENAPEQTDEYAKMDTAPLADYNSDFNNRFVVHNAQIKWNNPLRNIILRYIHQNSQRRGFVYYMSRRAIKFILDVLEGREKSDNSTPSGRRHSQLTQLSALSPGVDDEQTVEDRIEQILKDGRNFVNADEPMVEQEFTKNVRGDGPNDNIAQEYTRLNVYHFRLIAPQVQLQSEKNPKSVVLVTAKGMQLKIVQIMDKDNVNDDVSGLVQRRFTAAADNLQMFVTSTKTFSTEFFHMYSANLYGAKAGTQWPPWVPMEIMFEYVTNPYGFNRVVERTSASLRYDKYNNLRLKYTDDVAGEDRKRTKTEEDNEERMDHVWLVFPYLRAMCDSAQYYAMYIIVMDLLLYNEPLEKTRSERLEKIMLASDFSDLTGAPQMVQMLQERIRQLEEIKMHFQINERFLDRQGWKDRISMDQDLASCEDELFFMMKAITTSQQRIEDRREQENATGVVHLSMFSKEIAWHLTREGSEPLVEFQLKDASFERTDNNDGSNYNVMEIGRINGFNLLPDALYPEIIAPFINDSRGGRQLVPGVNMLRIHWLMLEAIAGIPVVDYFEIDLVPLKMQVEREVAKRLFEYVFPGAGGNAFEGNNASPFMVKNMLPPQEEEEDEGTKNEKASGTAGTETPRLSNQSREAESAHPHGNGNLIGSLEHRLQPTLHLNKQRKPKADGKGLGISHAGLSHGFGLFHQSDRPGAAPRTNTSRQALAAANSPRMSRSPSERSIVTMASNAGEGNEKSSSRRALLHRTHSVERKKKDERSDDLTQMMNRASNYMTLSFVKIPSMVLCLSYKGSGRHNIEDVHDLVFRMPTLEYRNKTWSNLDLALQLKKDVIRALISHAGAIVTNKFSHHRPTRQQQSRLRELANMSTFVASAGNGGSSGTSETNSLLDLTGDTPGRPSTASARPSTLNRTISQDSTPGSSANGSGFGHDEQKMAEALQSNGDHDGSYERPRSQPRLHMPGDSEPSISRTRAASFSRHISGFGERLRQRATQDSTTTSGEENEETNRKSAAQALFRVFIQPALHVSAPRPGILPHNANHTSRHTSVPHYQPTRSFSHTSIRSSKTREPEKRTQKWDEEITAKRIQLVNPETNQLPRNEETGELIESVQTRYDVLHSYDKKTHRLIQLSVDEPDNRYFIPICKIVSKKQIFDADKKRKVQVKERQKESAKASSVKTLELNWAIDGNDLAHRLEKVQDFLGEGRRVEIVLAAKKRGRKATKVECEGVLGKIRETLGAVPGAKEIKSLDGKLGGFATLILQGSASAAAAQAQPSKEAGG